MGGGDLQIYPLIPHSSMFTPSQACDLFLAPLCFNVLMHQRINPSPSSQKTRHYLTLRVWFKSVTFELLPKESTLCRLSWPRPQGRFNFFKLMLVAPFPRWLAGSDAAYHRMVFREQKKLATVTEKALSYSNQKSVKAYDIMSMSSLLCVITPTVR